MKWSFLLFSSFLCLQAIAQYPATGNKMRLGWQTTGDGLVYRGAIGDTATLDPSGINNAWMLLDTANGNLYAYRAKAWRLVSGGGGGGGVTMPFDSVTFNVNETDASQRELKYSEEKGYLQYGGLDSVQIPLLPGIWYVRNDTSVTIPKGTVVRATGTLGASGRIKVKHMIANGSIDAMYVLGIAMQDIAVGADGYVMTQGKIRNVNTQAYSEGAVLYADVDTLGGLTQTEPTGSNLKLPIAFVVHSASNGTLAVRVSPGTYLRDLHDAYITSPVSNASLYYNAAQGVWQDTTAAALKSDISGTANYLAKFTGSNAVGNSQIFDNGTNVGIGNASPVSGSGGGLTIGSPSSSKGLHLYSSGSGLFMYPPGSSNPSLQMTSSDADSSILYYTYFNYSHKFFTTNVERFRISHTGNVGINTTTPTAKLHINNPSSTTPALNIVSNSNVIGSTNDAVSINMQPGQVNQNNTGVRVFNTITGTSAEGNNTGIAVSLNARNSSYGVYSAVSKNWGGSSLFGEAIGVYGSATTDSPAGFSYGGYFKNDTTQGTGFGVFVQTTTPKGSGTVTPFAIQHNSTELMRVQSSGNVGIATSSPSRPLHVNANSSMIIPSGATGTRPASGADGDIRFNSTVGIKNLEWYNGAAWREPVNAARSPAAGLANRFSKFDANGLLDTSAVLTQANGRIGIWNSSPAASDSVLTVTGGIRATTGVRATLFNVNTFSTQVLSINNYAPAGSLGRNVWIGDGGQASQYTSGQAGGYNVSLGAEALKSNTTGFGNIAVASQALSSNTTGSANVAIGGAALSQNLTTSYNTAVGANALQNSKSESNTAIGASALNAYNQSTGESGGNVGIGASSLSAKTIGDFDIAIGYQAGAFISTTNGTPLTSSNKNIFIGARTYPNGNGQTGQIVIGHGAVGNGSNTTTIGNSSTTATILQYGETRLGMAVDSGAYTLQVNGNTKLIGNLARKKPVTIAAGTYTVLSDDSWLICNHTSPITITLPTAANSIGRELMIKYVAGGGATVISDATNVSPIVGGALTNIILPATAGSWVTLVCDGANWIIMQKG